jgi:hypothetical protein
MSEPIPPNLDPSSPIRERLLTLAPLLREAHHIGPEVQEVVADLVDELVRMMDPAAPSTQAEHLAATSTHLMQALHRKQHVGLLITAKERLAEAAARAEAEAPVATGLARRLIDALAGLGI